MGTLITVAAVSGANLFLGYGDYSIFFLLFVVKGFCFGGLQFLPIAMLADVVDVDSRAAVASVQGHILRSWVSEKIAIAFGTGVSLNIVGLLGFDPLRGVAGSTEAGGWRYAWCTVWVLSFLRPCDEADLVVSADAPTTQTVAGEIGSTQCALGRQESAGKFDCKRRCSCSCAVARRWRVRGAGVELGSRNVS